jgi:hypothetical protein
MEANNKPKQIVLHKSGYKNWRTKESFKDAAELQQHCINQLKMEDICYHFIIEKCGTLHGGLELRENSFATEGHNKDVIAICLLGEFTDEEPTTEQMDTLKMLTLAMCKQFNIKTDMHHIFCHCDYRDPPGDRFCPGKNLHRRVPEISRFVMDELRKERSNHGAQ